MYDDDLQAILRPVATLKANTRRLHYQLARTTPQAIGETAAAKVEQLKASNEAFRRMAPAEHARVQADIEREETARRRHAASVARFHLEPNAEKLDRLYRQFSARCRASADLTFSAALDHVDANGMLMFHLLKETIRGHIDRAPAGELLASYQRALEVRDARALIEAELIEERIRRGGIAANTGELPVIKELSELITEVQEQRVPEELRAQQVEETIRQAQTVVEHAKGAGVSPLNPEHPANLAAKQAFEQEQETFAAAEAAQAGGA